MERTALVALALAAAAAPGTSRADARSTGVRLAWVRGAGADECPTTEALAAAVARRLGYDPFTDPVTRTIDGVAAREGERWVARLYVRDATGALVGTREISSSAPACGSLGDAAVLAVVLAIDPEAALRPPPAAPAAPVAPVAPVAPAPPRPPPRPPVAPRAPARPAPAPRPPSAPGAVSVRALALRGIVPAVFAPAAALAVRSPGLGAFALGVGLLTLPAQPSADGNFAFGLTSAWLDGCVRFALGSRVRAGGCARWFTGLVHAFVRPSPAYVILQSGEFIWLAAGAAADVAVRLVGPLFVELEIGLAVPLTRYTFQQLGVTTPVFEQHPVALTGALGVGATF